MNTEFGIREAEDWLSGYYSYQSGSGMKSAVWDLSAEYWKRRRLSVLAV